MAHRAVRHVGRHAHRVLVWFGSVAAVLILLAAFGIWRLMQGPIELDRLAPYVEAAFERAHIGLKISLSHVRLGINPETHLLCVWVEGVRFALPNGEPLASFPEMTTSFSFGALFRGRIEPTQFIVERPVVHLVRDESGSFTARIGTPDQAAPDLGPAMLEQLAAPPQQDAPLGLLQALRIRGANVIVDDRQSGQRWEAQRVDATIERSEKGARGDLSLAIPIGATMPEVHAAYRYFADRHVLDLDIAIDGVQPSVIPPLVPELAQLRHLEAPVSGAFRTRISLDDGKAQGSRVDLSVGNGRLDSEWLPTGSIAIEKGELHAVYAPESAELRIEKATLDLDGGSMLSVDGSIGDISPELIAAPRDARPAGHVSGKLNATLTHVPVDRFDQLWPRAFSPGGRRWTLANVHDGVLDEATAHLALDIDPVAHTGSVLSAAGKLRYHDLTIGYFGNLPPVRKVNGTASFAGNHLEFAPTAGVLNGLKVAGGSLRLTELGSPTEWLTIDLPITGPLQDALEVLDTKPLGYLHAMGIDPAQVGGRAETQLHFKLPLLADLKLAQIEYGAKSTISSASINKIALDRGLTDGNFGLELNRDGAHLQGKARLAETPSQIDAEVFFHPKNGAHARYRLGMTLDDAARKRLDIDITPDRLTGPVGLDLTYSTFDRGRAEATALADLRATSLGIAEAGWKKAPDQPGTAKLVFELQDGRFTGTPQVEVKAAGLDGRFGIGLSSERKQINGIDIRRLLVGENDLSGSVTRRPDGGWRADIHAARADGRHLLKEAVGEANPGSPLPLAINARIDRLVLAPQRELQQVSAELLRNSGIWQSAKIDGRYMNGRQLSVRLGEGGGRRVVFQSDDLGAAMKLLDIADNVVGGSVTMTGQLSEAGGKRGLRGHIEGENYTLVRAPVMARLLALPSLTGIASMLSGSGLPFMSLRGDFSYSGSRIAFDRLLAYGESLGITANGWVDIDQDRLDVQGTLAPAYALNGILGNFPIIGPLLGGGSQGLFAANYRVSGANNDPNVIVNPLSALAPGILRQIFAPIVGVGQVQQQPGQATVQ
ncbi:MAG TPA: AsmA-like C-terminal region-containing protein [Stellaceae bacterium]